MVMAQSLALHRPIQGKYHWFIAVENHFEVLVQKGWCECVCVDTVVHGRVCVNGYSLRERERGSHHLVFLFRIWKIVRNISPASAGCVCVCVCVCDQRHCIPFTIHRTWLFLLVSVCLQESSQTSFRNRFFWSGRPAVLSTSPVD